MFTTVVTFLSKYFSRANENKKSEKIEIKIDGIKVFQLIETLKGLSEVQLSRVITEILNFNRDKTSRLGYATQNSEQKFETRNIMI